MKKKLLIIAIILLVVLVGGVIAIKMYRKHKKNSNPIGVYSVSYYSGYGMMDMEESYSGSVSSNGDQSVVLDNTKTVKEVLASEGDAVEAGDVLLTYDTYKESLQLDSMYSQLAVYNTNMTIAKKALVKLQNTTPVEKEEGPAATSPEEENASENDAATDDITDDASDGDAEETYTKEELELAIKKKNDEINSIQNSIDNQNLAIRKQERKINQGSVVAEADGVVVKVDMSDENISSGFPVIVVSSEGTYSTTVSVGELDIDNISIGDEATVYCYDTGEMYMGKVVNIGTSPNGTTSYPCVQSTYPVKVSLSDVEDMVDEAYVEVTINGSAEDFEGGGDDIMLPLFLTKKDNGGYFVMKEVDGRLKKQYLETGKIYYGSQIVVKSGVTSEDYIAFPYEKEAVEGKVTVHKENDDLY